VKTSGTPANVVVVGGGPAGMIAAGRAAACGARVTLLERNRRLGRKLLITGGGRCNVTNDVVDRHELVTRYAGRTGARAEGRGDGRARGLHSVFARFGPAEMRAFLRDYGLQTRVENEGRVFPVTDRAASVRSVLERYLAEGGVEVRTGCGVAGVRVEQTDAGARRDLEVAVDPGIAVDVRAAGHGGSPHAAAAPGRRRVAGVLLCSGAVVNADAVILATGGISRPETGSTGDGYRWLAELGHRVRVPEPSLVPIAVRESWPTQLQGLALGEVKLTALLDERPQLHATGKLLFTHFGLSGPLVLNVSSALAEVAQGGPVALDLDLFPSTDGGELDRRLQTLLADSSRRKLRNALGAMVPPRMAGVLLERASVDPDLACHSVPKEARRALVGTMKRLRLTFDSLLGADRAVVSSGGIDPDEVDFRSMASKRYPNLFVTGDLIDVDRRSGGYSLQLCWSTGWVAGETAAGGPGGRDAEKPTSARSTGR